MCPAVVSGIITGDVPVSYWSVTVPSDHFRSLEKVVSDGPGLVDFAIGLVNPVLKPFHCQSA